MSAERGRTQPSQTRRERPAPTGPAARRPRWPVPLILLGLLGLALAAILAVTTNNRRQLPADLNTTRQFTGTATSLFNQQALNNGDFANALMSNVPVTGQRTVRVTQTDDDDNALVVDERTLSVDSTQIGTGSNTYAIDRRSMEAASDAPADWNAQPHQGLTVGFPAGAQRRDYSGWVQDTQETTPVRFVREEARGGVNTYVYQTDVAAAPIRDQAVLSSLPTSLTRSALQGMAPSLPLPADQRALLLQALPGLPDQVPVTYTFQGSTTYWVEPTTGQIIDIQQQAVRNGVIGGPGGATLANLPVYNVDTRFTDDSVAAAGREAADRRSSLNTSGRVWPWVLGTLGALALLAGLLGLVARRRSEPAPARPEQRPDTTPRPATTGRGEQEAGRRSRETHGQPQAPYSGQTQHTGRYRETRAGESPNQPPSDEKYPTRDQPGQYPGGRQPPGR